MPRAFAQRDLPEVLSPLTDLALDVRWTWSHAGDALWRMIDASTWEQSQNPWEVLQNVSRERLDQLARDPGFLDELRRLAAARRRHLDDPGWYGRRHAGADLRAVAYFSMEFGLSEALPLYAGGLGVLAGDYLKTASDLGVPVAGVGLLYQEGFFRQFVDARGAQQEVYPYNDPTSLPVQPAFAPSGAWLHVPLRLPGRILQLRAWRIQAGRVALYLLDSNDPLNSPVDRGITGKLYAGGMEMRLLQEIVLGVGGWRALRALDVPVDVCHLNEGHAALVVIERARHFMEETGVSFWEALWATRAGNVFTTHTPIAAGFDLYSPELIEQYFPYYHEYVTGLGIAVPELLALGRRNPHDPHEPFNMAHLALRGCGTVSAVSRLHGAVSRRLFQSLYDRWPEREVPIGHVTNGVHVPSWDSAAADELWTRVCGKDRWLGEVDALPDAVRSVDDAALWDLRAAARRDLVRYVRERLARQLGQRGSPPDVVAQAQHVLDPDVLTLGFARRFTAYKRPDLLLRDPARLRRLLTDPTRPVQIIVAGKAHPDDWEGKRFVQAWIEFVRERDVRSRAVFLEDYDLTLAQRLVQGVDVWVNTPRRPWEACGTSGMKVLANGGLNLSELDGWWAEAYAPEVGWALGDGREHDDPGWDVAEAEQLYRLLDQEVVPAFYTRDAAGTPRAWVARIRESMASLTPRFSSNRMMREYVERCYLPAAEAFRRRSAGGGAVAKLLRAWQVRLTGAWDTLRFGQVETSRDGDNWSFRAQVYLGDAAPDDVRLELYADPAGGGEAECWAMERAAPVAGATNAYWYRASVPALRPDWHYTARAVPGHPDARVPLEISLIRWQR